MRDNAPRPTCPQVDIDDRRCDGRKEAYRYRDPADRATARRALCGSAENWVKLQRKYDCYFLIADYQVSDCADDLQRVRNAVWEVALDWLAVGLDPERSSLVIESLVPEHAELTTWLGWLLPVGMLESNPTLKAEMEAIENPEDATTKRKSVPVAFYIYPVMADCAATDVAMECIAEGTHSRPWSFRAATTCGGSPENVAAHPSW